MVACSSRLLAVGGFRSTVERVVGRWKEVRMPRQLYSPGGLAFYWCGQHSGRMVHPARAGFITGRGMLLAILAGCLCAVMMTSCCWGTEEGCAARELVEGFVAADIGRAKAVTVPEQWARIEEAMKGRQPFWCHRGDWETTGTGAVGLGVADGEWVFSATYQCGSEETPYCLTIDDIVVRKTSDGWKVHDWGRVCEAHDYGYVCEQQCR